MTGHRRRLATLLSGLLALGLLTACSDRAPSQPARPDAVALTARLPEHLTVGVVVTLASAPGQGAEWRDAAEGARVAARRFAMGGADVTLVAVNDKGTVAGAAAAVSTLAGQGVAGIVLASSGGHVQGALDQAAESGVPLLLPYAGDTGDLPEHVWRTEPDPQVVDARLVQAVATRGATRPYLIRAGGAPVAGLTPVGSRTWSAGADTAALATSLARQRAHQATTFDAVVVSGPAERQAQVVRALQGATIDVPVFLTADALSPAFPVALSKAQGSLAGDFVSAGLDDGDAAALEPTAAGRALTAYFSALRLTAADPGVQDLLGDRPYAAVAATADVRSHDAVVALVRAAEKAGSADPAKVTGALAGLKLDASAGLAGPPLDFSTPVAVADAAAVALASTPASPGVRPAVSSAVPALYWFPVAAS